MNPIDTFSAFNLVEFYVGLCGAFAYFELKFQDDKFSHRPDGGYGQELVQEAHGLYHYLR